MRLGIAPRLPFRSASASQTARAFLTLLSPRLPAQTIVHGAIADSLGRPLRGAVVSVVGGPVTTADSLGRFELRLRRGQYVFDVVHPAFYREDSVFVATGRDTVRRDFVLRRRPALSNPFDVWLGCAAVAPTTPCQPGRHIESELEIRQPGVWIVDDSAAFATMWRTYYRDPPIAPLPFVRWKTERVLVLSYGGSSGCGTEIYINRLEHRHDSTIVVLGPDSLRSAGGYDTCAMYQAIPDIVVITRWPEPLAWHSLWPRRPIPPVHFGAPPS